MAKETLDLYFAMQNLNRATIKYAAGMIKVGMNLPDIKALCENYCWKMARIPFGIGMLARLFFQEMRLLFLYQAKIIT